MSEPPPVPNYLGPQEPPSQSPQQPQRWPQPGSRVSAIVCWIAILGTIGLVAGRIFVKRNAPPPVEDDESAEVSDVQLEMSARLLLGQKQMAIDLNQPTNAAHNSLRSLDQRSRTRIDKLRAAIVAAELEGAEATKRRLDVLQSRATTRQAATRATGGTTRASTHPTTFATTQPLDQDIATLRKIYDGQLDQLSTNERAALTERHGWFGQLALAFGLQDSDPQRELVIRPARLAAWVSVGAVLALFAVVGVGVVLLIIGIVMFSSGSMRRRYQPVFADPSRPAFLEAFAIYTVAFFLIVHGLAAISGWFPIVFYLLSMLLIPLALWWPTRRGLSSEESWQGFGWHRGRGVFAEMGAGVIGYIAGLPIVAIGFVTTFFLSRYAGTDASHPLVNELRGGGIVIGAIYFMACIFAPVMEETMFRGALYNHLRGWHNWFVSAVIVGVLFAAVHPQGWAALPVLGSIGAVMCVIREWRGSLIGPMTAHALNNGTAITIVLLLLG